MTQEIKVTTSSGNVFADLGLPNPDEMLAKAKAQDTLKHRYPAKRTEFNLRGYRPRQRVSARLLVGS